MESLYISEKRGGKGLKMALFASILMHTLFFVSLFSFRESMQLPGLIEVDIVMDGGMGTGVAPVSAVETESDKVHKKTVVRKPLRYVKTEAPLVEKRAVPPVRMVQPPVEEVKSVKHQEQSHQQSVRVLPNTQVPSEARTQPRESIPFTNAANYQVTTPLATGVFSGARGDGRGAGDVGKGSIRQFRSMVLRRIEAAKIYPERARRRGIEGDATVDFTVLPDGTVEAILVTDESRCHTLLKRAAVRTVQRAAPYLPLPASIQREEGVRMKVKITFHLS